MQDNNNNLSPINLLFLSIAAAPFIAVRVGDVFYLLAGVFILYILYYAYTYYKEKASKKNISFQEALDKDLPDMSPIHFIFFMLIAAPIFFMIFGTELKDFTGLAIVWIIYAVYYYGFKTKA